MNLIDVNLIEKAQRALEIVCAAPEMVYDVETSGLDWKRNSIVGYVITSRTESLYIPVRHAGGGNLLDPKVPALVTETDIPAEHWFERALAEAFTTRRQLGYLTIGHNIGFDALFSWKHGIQIGRNLADTQHQATMLDEHQESFSLEHTATVMQVTPKAGQPMYDFLSRAYGGKADKKQMAHFWRTAGNEPIVMEYAEGDGISTFEVYDKQLPHLASEGLEQIMRVENHLIWTLVRMERRGIKIAAERFKQALDEINAKLAEARAKLPPGFNVRSPSAVRALAERAGKTDWPLTAPSSRFPNGQPSYSEAFLETFEEGRVILRVRRLERLGGTFIVPLRDVHMFEGRVHAHINQLKADEYGTISGRVSCSNPNLQQVIARDPELGRLYRMLFVADAGMTMAEADYSQVEPRLWAHYSGDHYLNEGYRSTPVIDVHQVTSNLIHVERKLAKSINLGLFYLMGTNTFHKHMSKHQHGIAREQSDALYNAWYSNFDSIKRFQKAATDVLKNRGYVRTILGRRSRDDGTGRHYVASNRIIQGGSADITKAKLLEVDIYFESIGDIAHLLMTVHDSIVFQFPTGDAEIPARVMAIMTDLNGAPWNLTIPFTVDLEAGLDWAQVKGFSEEDE